MQGAGFQVLASSSEFPSCMSSISTNACGPWSGTFPIEGGVQINGTRSGGIDYRYR